MNILFIAAEAAPFVKVGGLADVVGSLPASLLRLGHNPRVIIPHHGTIDDVKHGIEPLESFDIPWMGGTAQVEVSVVRQDDVPIYFLRAWPYFQPDQKFVYDHDDGMNIGRFLFFCFAALHYAAKLAEEDDWRLDIAHIHDWHTALVAYLLARVFSDHPVLGRVPSILTIHNMRYQGWGVGWHLSNAGLPPVDHGLLNAMDRANNTLAIGLAYSTMITTVSPRYAQEILEPEGGYGLDSLLHARLSRLVGILNGIDVQRWDPEHSAGVPTHFTADQVAHRRENKLALQREVGLPQKPDVPVIGTVMRLVDQKGPNLIPHAVRYMLSVDDVQFVLLGTGHWHYENEMWWIGHDFPEKASINLNFNEGLAEKIYAGVDMFLMPSLFEPCGIGQMIAMRYGAIPIVREVGGLADTVTPDIGFLFRNFDSGGLGWAMGQALEVYWNNPQGWQARQRRAMRADFSWEASAERYIDVYERAVGLKQTYA
ncbi:MAG: glycogen synthase [Chloroflexi bacterium]|nr:glycogen synthase [Chloroflexota bacterium]